MRKTTQSMYQSNLKVPVTASKVFDGSQLFKSSTAIPGNARSKLRSHKKSIRARSHKIRSN